MASRRLRNMRTRLWSTFKRRDNARNENRQFEIDFLSEKKRISSEIIQEIKKNHQSRIKFAYLNEYIPAFYKIESNLSISKTVEYIDFLKKLSERRKKARDISGSKKLLENVEILEHHLNYRLELLANNSLFTKKNIYLVDLINENIYFLIKKIENFLFLPTSDKWNYIKHILFNPEIINLKYENEKSVILTEVTLDYKLLMKCIDFLRETGYNYRKTQKMHLDLILKLEEYFDLCKEYRKKIPQIETLADSSNSLQLLISYHGGIKYYPNNNGILKKVNIPPSLNVYKLMNSTYGTVAITNKSYYFFRSKNKIDYDKATKIIINAVQSNLPHTKNIEKSSINILKKLKTSLTPILIFNKRLLRPLTYVAPVLPNWFVSKLTKKYFVDYVNHGQIHINKLDKTIVYKEYMSTFSDGLFHEQGFYLITKNNTLDLLHYLDLDLFFDYDNCWFVLNTEEILEYLAYHCKYLSIIDLSCSSESTRQIYPVNTLTTHVKNIEGKSITSPINNVNNYSVKIMNPKSLNISQSYRLKNIKLETETESNILNNMYELSEPKNQYNGYPEAKGSY
jgi:hypothetical protein